MPSILFVCTANRCRSPVAAALMQRHVAVAAPGERWQIESAGTWALPDLPADVGMRSADAQVGLDLSQHRAQPVSGALLDRYDLILTMEAGQQEALQIEFPHRRGHIYLLSELTGPRYDVDDPIGGSPEEYAATVRRLERLIREGFPHMQAILEGK